MRWSTAPWPTGRVGGEPVRFDAEPGPYTVLILTPGADDAERLEREVAATACAVRLAGGGEAQVRGNRQGVSTTTDGASSIGVFDRDRRHRRRCAARASARPRSRRERQFIVSAREGLVRRRWWCRSGIAAVAALLGGLLIAWGIRGRVIVARP